MTIAQENALPGTPQSVWDVNGAGDSSIQGFATDISYNVGQTVSFKINDTAKAPYHIDIYRMGYYQGNGARLITSIPASQTLDQVQPSPITDSTTGLVDCGNWAVSATWNIPSDATSGIYFGKLIRDDTGAASHVVFIVRNDASHSALLFQTSDATWEAYNTWGTAGLNSGNSLYEENQNTNLRAYKVSYNRPFTDRGIGGGLGTDNWVFHAEYPMVRWLESNGYDVTYFTDMDADRYGSLIKNHKVYMSVGHDEYWSGGQFTNVMAARDAGVDLAFFSGNEIFWKTRWENSIDRSNTPYRTLVCYKETHANAVIDPMDPPIWTGSWMDPRFSPPADGGRPQNQLSGTLFTVNRGSSDLGTPFTVPYADSQFRFWRNTSVATLAPGQTATLGDYELGYEWDEDVDNGFRPGGEIDMSSTTQNVTQKFIDYGNNVAPGVATHSLTLYRAASGALVFSAGTVQWSWGLDSNHDDGFSATVPAIQQATVNLLADMGAQPATLQSGLKAATASTDTIAPTSTITAPTPNSNIQDDTTYTITGTATDAGGGVVAGVEVSVDGGATWHPAVGHNTWSYTWTPNTDGTITIKSRATDDSGNTETPSAGVSVNLSGPVSIWGTAATPMSVNDTDTSSTEVGVKIRSTVSGYIDGIRFYKGPLNTGTHVGDFWTGTGTKLASATFTNETSSGWEQVLFASPVPINANTTYVASYHTSVGQYAEDDDYFLNKSFTNGPLTALMSGVDGPDGVYSYGAAGTFPSQTYQSANYWVDVLFSTAGVDTTPPTVVRETPSSNSTGVDPLTSVTVTFSEPVQPSTISLQLTDPSHNAVSGSLSYDGGSNSETLMPAGQLAANTIYTVSVSGTKDLAGNVMTPVSWTFSTGAPVGPGPYSIWSPSAAPQTVDDTDTSSTEVGVKFRSDIAGTITGIRFYKGALNTGTHVADLWNDAGTLLATATFANETASGWQQVNFSTPVNVSPNTTYIASYHTNVGRYAEDDNYFTSTGVDNGPLHALAAGIDGANGVYAYGPAGSFPTQNWLSANYWVDVVLASTNIPPAVTAETPAANATAVPVGSSLTATFSKAVQASTIAFTLKDSHGNVVASSGPTYNSGTLTATLTPNAPLAYSTTYTATVSGAMDSSGNAMVPFSWSFTTAAAPTPPVVTAESPAPNATGVPTSTAVSITFNEPIVASTLQWTLTGPGGTSVSFTSSYNSGSNTATITPTSLLAGSSTYSVTASGATDQTGTQTMTPFSWSFTTAVPDTTPPSITTESPVPGAGGVSTATTVTATFSEAIQQSTLVVTLKDTGGNAVAGTVSYNASTLTVTFTPASLLSGSMTYTASVSASDLAGNAMTSPFIWSFQTASVGGGPFTIWPSTAVPTTVSDPDSQAVELGVKFRSDIAGYVTGIRFYKGSTNTGTHYGHLWTSTGTLLATATFINETSSGWEQVNFTTPVLIAANTTYIASYHTDVGHYAAGNGYFAAGGVNAAPLHALQDGTDGGDGVYAYGPTGSFPSNTYQSTNYWVDVVFSPHVWMQNTVSDFSAGTTNGTIITNNVDGEVQLAPAFEDDFTGTALASSWTTTSWTSAGGGATSITVSGGILSLAGAEIRSAPLSSAVVEGRITIGAVAKQQFGLATDLAANAGNYWAVFTTQTSTTTLYAQVNVNGTLTTTSLGTRPSGYHVYRVQQISTGFQFYIDGVLKTTISKTLPTGTSLRMTLSAFSATPVMLADWVRVASYQSGGTFVSSVLDTGETATWGGITWDATLPTGTSLLIETSSGNTATPDSSWSAWSALGTGNAITSPSARYLRYRITFITTDPSQSAVLSDSAISFW